MFYTGRVTCIPQTSDDMLSITTPQVRFFRGFVGDASKMALFEIQIATTDQEIEGCYDVLRELRPHLQQDTFLATVRRMEKTDNFTLAFMSLSDSKNEVVAVAGFRCCENLAVGKYLYVDDLVTASRHRSKGYGKQMLDFLAEYGTNNKSQSLRLDSRFHRTEAHRFYERYQMEKAAFHFIKTL